MKRAAAVLLLLAGVLFAGCDAFKDPLPTESIPQVPFGAPQTVWNTGRGSLFVYTTDNRSWNQATQAEFQRAFDDLLFRLQRVVGAEVYDRLRVDGLNLVLQDPRKDPKWDPNQRSLFTGGSDDFAVALLELWCYETSAKPICDLRR